ncbi:LOW QUALITY PROTEIN: interleukin-6-like [Morone saxatilis]|uniref:LOW QUALITY PROTEIN: interleukin-6-like n=1 Tax=Morone saxatilis TaxID=34816 RepID=UPI0015E24FA7|nr:LOW QUALITY PROTEIN: interleukin-6-like [Morone saxatilis]
MRNQLGSDEKTGKMKLRGDKKTEQNQEGMKNAYLLSALTLAAALQCAPGAPVADAPTDSPAGDSSAGDAQYSLTSKTCPEKSSKEVCLRWLAQGLLTYTALLKHVEKESPSSIRSEGQSFRSLLLKLTSGIKNKMRHSEHVKALTSSQEGQLLRDFDSPDPFHRLMTTFKILYKLRDFLIDGIKNIRKTTIVWPMGVRYQYTTNNYKSITNQL